MNWSHFRAFGWLRWRLMYNQCRRAGALSAALMIIIAASCAITAIPLGIGSFALGVYLIPKAEPAYLMYAWDALILAFLMFWMIGLLTELQRNDPLALSKFLHLPVSVREAFAINYASSLLKLTLLFFGPVMIGYALALVYVQGARQLPVLPALAAFLLLITAPTYQFQGWLASLMNNPRRRRAVMVGTTMLFVLVFQVPNLANFYFTPRFAERQAARTRAFAAEQVDLQTALATKAIDAEEYNRRQKAMNDRQVAERDRETRETAANVEAVARRVNAVVPLGWLPLGVATSAEGRFAPALLGVAGMTAIGAFSLWRAYRTTIDQFQGQGTNRKARPRPRAEAARVGSATPRPVGRMLMELQLPGLSEPVSAIALGGFRSLLRSPEAKISLITPLIMGGIFGSMLYRNASSMSEAVRPLFGVAAIAFVLFGLLQLMSNQFGTDRDGFRVFVLCAAPRRDILLGKNLAHLPAALLLSAILVGAALVLCPMRVDHALAMAPQFVSMFLMFCLLANLTSILTPVYMAAGTLKPANPKATTVLLQLVLFMVLFPLFQGLTLIPLGVEALLRYRGQAGDLPVALLLAVAECALISLAYALSLRWMGGWLQSREKKILETVTNRRL